MTFRPGAKGWEAAKFRFRSSVFTLVTIVDHLYGIHLQVANLLVTAMREQLSADHPVRRFLTPYTYHTIVVNSNARQNLVAPQTMADRCFALSPKGTRLAWAAAPSLVMGGVEVLELPGDPVEVIRTGVNRKRYINEYLRKQRGIDTPYYKWNERYWDVTYKFLSSYLDEYYGGDWRANMRKDAEVLHMVVQYLEQME